MIPSGRHQSTARHPENILVHGHLQVILFHRTSRHVIEGKAERQLQEELGLANPDAILCGNGYALDQPKGFSLIPLGAMHRLICAGIEVVLGTGDTEQEDAMRFFDEHYGNRMAARNDFDIALSPHVCRCGYVLMPSEFEPCGLPQMIYALWHASCCSRDGTVTVKTVQPVYGRSI